MCNSAGQWEPVNVQCIPGLLLAGPSESRRGLGLINSPSESAGQFTDQDPTTLEVILALSACAVVIGLAVIILGYLFIKKRKDGLELNEKGFMSRLNGSCGCLGLGRKQSENLYDEVYTPSSGNRGSGGVAGPNSLEPISILAFDTQSGSYYDSPPSLTTYDIPASHRISTTISSLRPKYANITAVSVYENVKPVTSSSTPTSNSGTATTPTTTTPSPLYATVDVAKKKKRNNRGEKESSDSGHDSNSYSQPSSLESPSPQQDRAVEETMEETPDYETVSEIQSAASPPPPLPSEPPPALSPEPADDEDQQPKRGIVEETKKIIYAQMDLSARTLSSSSVISSAEKTVYTNVRPLPPVPGNGRKKPPAPAVPKKPCVNSTVHL